MKIKKTKFGEIMYKWQNHKHPEITNFMQTVIWIAFEKPDGRYMIGYKLSHQDQSKWIEFGEGNIHEAIEKYL